jgi:EmrB/QacA subfamily drug resistance transporter
MERNRTFGITLGVMFALFMAAVETTVVATAMPTIISDLGGVESYSWVFSVYMLASTTTIPLYGKLSDVHGRRPIFMVAMGLFLAGSVLSGQSRSIGQLIGFRALQGLGAGGLLPLSFIMIGDLFSFEQRARMQGLFSGVWGVASIIGPLVGGFLVDQVSWRWVFYVNVAPGFLAAALVWTGWRHMDQRTEKDYPPVDYSGAGLMTAGVVALLLGLFDLGSWASWTLLASAAALFIILLPVEQRAPDPVLPLALFRRRLFAVSTAHGVLVGWAMFGSTSFVPLFIQSVLGTSATLAGSALTPQMLGWVFASITGSRLLLRFSYRTLALAGMTFLTLGAFLMSMVSVNSTLAGVMVNLALMGIGMGLSVPPFLIAVQSTVERSVLGTATATLQFSRVIGGALGVSVMGLIMNLRFSAKVTAEGLDKAAVSLHQLIRPLHAGAPIVDIALRRVLTGAIEAVFVAAFVAAAAGLVVAALAPRGRISQLSKSQSPPDQVQPPLKQ